MPVKTCIILNPSAGCAGNVEELRQKFQRLTPQEIFVTSEAGHAEKFAREAASAGFELIVAAGGDGTLNEIVNGIADRASKVCVGLVPLGTGNDFARSVEIPTKVDESIELIRSGRTQPFDLVRVTSDRTRYFINVSTGGFSGIVDEKLTPEMKQTWGPLAYLRSAAAALPELRAYETAIVFDDAENISLNLYNVIVGNGRFVAGGIPVAPNAVLDDGLLDIILILERPAPDLAVLAAQALLGKHLSSDSIIYRKAAKVSVQSTPGMWFNVDGELVGNEPAVFEVVPGAIQFIVGPK